MAADDTQPQQTAEERDGSWIVAGRYRLIRRLGAGGMATVFLAVDEVLAREVAVKQLQTGGPGGAVRRFAREARLGAALNHPNIVAVYDIVSEPDHVVIVMEYVRGGDLSAVLRDGPPEEREALRVLRAVAAALDHAHERGIVHRDVKPSNVLIRDDGAVKLADLGIARALADTGTTEVGYVPGTPLYMAPELLAGKRVTAAADVCSLALVAYEVLSGRRPRSGRTVPEVAGQATTQPPPDLLEARPQTPPAAAELLSRAMDRDPDRRPATAGELIEGLRAALVGGRREGARASAPAPVPTPSSQGSRPPTERLATSDRPVPLPEPEAEHAMRTRSAAPREWAPSSARVERARTGRWIIPALLAAVVAVVAVVVATLFVGGDSDEASSARKAGSAGSASKENPTQNRTPAPTSAASAERTVQSFYERAAAGDYARAEALATPALLSQIGGFGQFDTLQSIHFEQLEGTVSGDSAEVTMSTVATHTDRVDHCAGSAGLVLEDRWLLDSLAVDCG